MVLARLERSVDIDAPVEEVFRFCASAEGFRKHFPFPVVWEKGPENFSPGANLSFSFRMGGIWFPWEAEIVAWEANRMFADEMRAGPYRSFRHTHHFAPVDGRTRYTDVVEFDTGWGSWINRTVGMWTLRSVFRKRQNRLKAILEEMTNSTVQVAEGSSPCY